MSTNNKVMQVLVTKGNQAPVAKDKAISDLAAGQIGVFNADTGLSIDATATGVTKIFLAVGNTDPEKVQFSAGQSIQKSFFRHANLKDYVAATPYVFELSGYKALNGVDYAIKLEFRNMKVYNRQGTNQFTRTYSVTTSSDENTEPILDLATKLIAEFALDTDISGMFTVAAYSPLDNSLITDLAAFGVAHPGVAPKIRITANTFAIENYLGLNPLYIYPRQGVVLASLVDGFTSEATIATIGTPVAEQGAAYDIKQKEYKAGGWSPGKGGNYRTSSHLGYPYNKFYYNAVDGVNYMQLELIYDFYSTAGWSEYLSNLQTIVAIPTGETTTSNGLKAILNAVLGTSL